MLCTAFKARQLKDLMVSTKFNINVKEHNEKKKGSTCNKAVNSHNHDDVDAGEVLPLEGDSDG